MDGYGCGCGKLEWGPEGYGKLECGPDGCGWCEWCDPEGWGCPECDPEGCGAPDGYPEATLVTAEGSAGAATARTRSRQLKSASLMRE